MGNRDGHKLVVVTRPKNKPTDPRTFLKVIKSTLNSQTTAKNKPTDPRTFLRHQYMEPTNVIG